VSHVVLEPGHEGDDLRSSLVVFSFFTRFKHRLERIVEIAFNSRA